MAKTHKKQANISLGRSLIKNQHKLNYSNELTKRHTDDSLNNKSITENTSLDDFLSKTKLANSQFIVQQENLTIVNNNVQLLSSSIDSYSDLEKEILIPRRPKLDKVYSAEQLKQLENENYLKWRRKLAIIQEKENVTMTPFEKNLEFWRQLWRVVEKSDIIIQILDSRNPLLFYCEDLDKYIKEVNLDKMSVILLNKSDYLTDKQRKYWLDYFSRMNKNCIFFSALEQQVKMDQIQNNQDSSNNLLEKFENLNLQDFSKPLNYYELISYFKSLKTSIHSNKSTLMIGFVGFPNVGKSSTINALLRAKKVSVSATPGKTKHFQTMILDQEITICDCPGLVFPNFVSNKAEMIINGILPIDQIKDVIVAIGSITSKIPAHIFESMYGIILKKPDDNEHDPNRKVTPLELLSVYGYSRGFMTQRGLPDTSKAAKFILKDFVVGKILYCYAPPNVDQEEYHKFTQNNNHNKEISDRKLIRIYEDNNLINSKDFDQEFFHQKISMAHVKSSRNTFEIPYADGIGKPWKKHNKRNKKEKLRRIYAHLDN